MDKYDVKVIYKSDYTSFKISSSSTISKLLQFIEISYEELKNVNYSLFFNQTNLKLLGSEVKLSSIFQSFLNSQQEAIQAQANPSLTVKSQIELTIQIENEDNDVYTVECNLKEAISSFKISSNLTFQKFKFNILTCFPSLEQENYQIIYQTNDITNYYSNEIQLKHIFTITKNNIIKIKLSIQPKIIIEYHKRCSFCHIKKGILLCRKCALVNCEDCSGQDIHNASKNINYILISSFKNFEQRTLEDILKQLSQHRNENDKVNSNQFIALTNDKLGLINKKFEEMCALLHSIRDTQINNLSNIKDSIINKYHPEKLNQMILDLYDAILKYKLNPFYDCEESMRKIIEYELIFLKFTEDFNEYLTALMNFNDKYQKCSLINKKVNEMLQFSLTETQLVFKEKAEEKRNNYNVIMKIYDCSSVLVYDNDKELFYLMNFHDEHNKFKENFNNFIQLNYKGEKLFIVTGNPCQQFFCYDIKSNEMQFISTLKFNHNWWPSLISVDEPQQGIDLFCLTGSYTIKCEMLLFNTKLQPIPIRIKKKEAKQSEGEESKAKQEEIEMEVQKEKQQQGEGEEVKQSESNLNKDNDKDESNQYDSLEKPIEVNDQENIEFNSVLKLSNAYEWEEISNTEAFHGQGASFVLNNEFIYLFFGYDYNHAPIALIEKLNIKDISFLLLSQGQLPIWETIKFNNPDNISSFLYYNALLKVNDDNILVLGGLKEINELDVVYCFEPKTNSLLKINKKIQFNAVQFCNEKLCFKLTKEEFVLLNKSKAENEYALIDGKNNIHIFKETSLDHKMITFNPSF